MTYRPILFSAPMVRALLDGRKTQTRRTIKPPPKWGKIYPVCNPDGVAAPHEIWWWDGEYDRVGVSQRCPYGSPGDRLWVREAWAPVSACTHNDPGVGALSDGGFYRADNSTIDGEISKWRPSIHMPRRASRLWLTVTDVRVQRLREISEGDAAAEGIRPLPGQDAADPSAWWEVAPGEHQARSASESYRKLWNAINGEGSWDANPWVWAVSFTVHRGNIGDAP